MFVWEMNFVVSRVGSRAVCMIEMRGNLQRVKSLYDFGHVAHRMKCESKRQTLNNFGTKFNYFDNRKARRASVQSITDVFRLYPQRLLKWF